DRRAGRGDGALPLRPRQVDLLSTASVRGGTTSRPARLRVYNLIADTVAFLVAPVAGLILLFRPTWRKRLGERLGFGWPGAAPEPTLWAHAASVGEVEGIGPLVGRWRDEHPGGRVVVSALTATGCDVARTILP